LARGLQVKKSKNFDANLDPVRMVTEIDKNVRDVTFVAGEKANFIAPIDTGKLRQSKRVRFEVQNGKLVGINEWKVYGKPPKRPRSRNPNAKYPYNYALIRFRINKKNPHTTRWTERDLDKNGNFYLKAIQKGVLKT